ncbi:hypothetical protein FGIG_06496 [Fasciola gigantica]|uniref:Uncharacterized protein n=1 Tax=Fasciola gigantica TaxID=46835 RepID=A0A504YRS5_FASGI|nr:hypothetical protein FGIG_06496 [Fasciola gigantica]
MEEEDSNSNSKIDSVPVADFSSDTVVHVDDAAPVEITNRSTSPNVVTVCPVNPKKRLISQFSVAGEESVCAVSAPADVVPSVLTTSAPSTTTLDGTTDVSMLSPPGQLPVVTDQTPTEQCTSHSTPLPPKKATVKQQAEQHTTLVRSSSSLRNSSSSNSVKPIGDDSKQPQTTSKNSTIEQFGSILPPGLVDPGILLEELPKFYDQLRLPATVSTEPTQPVEPVVSPATLRSSVDRDSDSLSSKLTHAPLMSVLESRVTERGPRTPSEPPDEEDYEDLDGDLPSTVYCRQLSVPHPDSLTTNSTAGISNGPCWSSDRSPQRTVDAARPFSTTCSNYTECKLVPVIAHSQFLRAPTRTAVRDAGFFPSTGISQTAPGEAQQSTTSLGGISSGYPGKQAHSPIRASRQLDSNGLHRSSGRIRNHSSLSASVDNSIHCSPPLPPPPPPPPPPPIRSALSSNTLVDYEATSPMDSGPHVRLSGSDVPATYGEAEHMLKTNSLEYFIRRDQEIRSWQEARSYEWDRRRGSSGNRPSVEVHSHTRHGCQRRHSWRNSAAYAALPSHHPGWSGLDEKYTRHTGSNVAGQLFDVEQTLHRLQDSLRAQLDRTRMALTPHNGSTLNRLPSFHSTGCAVDASDLTPYAAERLEYHRRFSLTEQRIHTNSSPN